MVVPPMLQHVIVDGSNIATEGRDVPSLAQLDEAVQAFIREYEPEIVTVVVDATFPNRIAGAERKLFEDALVAGELITPPAGAIGRGDAFVLQIADRVGAAVLSNDSFQEFHGTYDWLFDEGRLIGGKPVPHVGWVFMPRTPVRGPASRRAVSAAKRAQAAPKVVVEAADRGDGMRKPGERAAKAGAVARTDGRSAEPRVPAEPRTSAPAVTPTADDAALPTTPAAYNEAVPFVEFVRDHPVGSAVDAVVEHFGSHGAYLRAGDIRAYAPLKNLADPAPRSAKDVLRAGESRRFVVASIDPPRRGVDLAIPGVLPAASSSPVAASPAAQDDGADRTNSTAARTQPRRERARAARRTGAKKVADKHAGGGDGAAAGKATARQARAKKAAAKADPAGAEQPTRGKAPARRAAPSKKARVKKAATRKRAAG